MEFSPQFVALASTAAYAAGNLYARSGLSFSTPLTMTLLSLMIQTTVVWLAVFMTGGARSVDPRALFVFVTVGATMPVVRLLTYTGIARIGSSRAASLRSTHPLFSAILAVLVLGEPAKRDIILGTLLVVAGIFLTCWERRAQIPGAKRTDALFPLSAAFLSGLIHPAARYAMMLSNEPLFFSATVGFVSLLCFSAYLFFTEASQKLVWHRRAVLPLMAAGLLETLGFLLFSAAVSLGPVVLIAPILATTPLWVLIGSILLLRDLEKVTLRTAIGTAAVVAGTILLALN